MERERKRRNLVIKGMPLKTNEGKTLKEQLEYFIN